MSTWSICFLSLFGTALPPAFQVKEIAVRALPGIVLVADTHVFWKGSVGTVVMFLEDQILGDGKEAAGTAKEDGDLDPDPQFVPLFGVALVRVGFHELLLVGDAGADLCNGLGLHFGLGPELGNGLDGSSGTGGTGSGGQRHASAGQALCQRCT